MAYLILSTDGHEWDRRELTGPIVLGRSPDCEISVHDILLSRRHCRITPTSSGWLLIDLASRNGTLVRDAVVEQCRLKHGDVIRAGKTKVTFRTDVFVPNANRPKRPESPQPIHLDESLEGTVVGMHVVTDAPASPTRRTMHRPTPKPRPMDPLSFQSDDLYSMLEQIASSSWDSIYATNSRPLRNNRVLPEPIVAGKRYGVPRQKSPVVSLSLQVMPAADAPPRKAKPGLAQRTRNRLSQILMRIMPATPMRRAA